MLHWLPFFKDHHLKKTARDISLQGSRIPFSRSELPKQLVLTYFYVMLSLSISTESNHDFFLVVACSWGPIRAKPRIWELWRKPCNGADSVRWDGLQGSFASKHFIIDMPRRLRDTLWHPFLWKRTPCRLRPGRLLPSVSPASLQFHLLLAE